MNRRSMILLGILAVVVIGLAGYAGAATSKSPTPAPAPDTVEVTSCDVEQSVAAPGVLNNTSETQVLMPVDGKLAEVLVRAGDRVEAGEVLARVDPISRAEAWTALRDAEDAYLAAFNYRKSLEGEIWLDRVTYEGKGPQQVAVHHWYKGRADAETIEAAENNLALKQAELDAARATLENMELKAPFTGIVVEVNAGEDRPFHADDVLVELIDPQALEVVANITEEDFPLMSVGQDAEIYFDARPDVIAAGNVSSIIPIRIEGSDTPLYDITISLADVPEGLADGMTASAAITIARRERVLCLPRAVVRASGSDTTVLKIWDGVEELERQITLGLRGDTYVEIVSGLSEGERVITR